MKRSALLVMGVAVLLLGPSAGLHRDQGRPAPGIGAADNAFRDAAELFTGMIREVTAYNVGVRAQTSEFPCIGAMGHDLCELLRQGRRVCAANFVAFGTILDVEGFGECIVLDRMNRRYSQRVDIAMREDEVAEARTFGVRRLVVEVK